MNFSKQTSNKIEDNEMIYKFFGFLSKNELLKFCV